MGHDLTNRKNEIDTLLTNIEKFEKSDGAEGSPNVEGLLEYLTNAKAEPTLLAAVPSAMQTSPSARGRFDSLACTEVRKIIESDWAAIKEKLASKETEARQVKSEALGLWAIHEVASDRWMEAKGFLNQTKETAQGTKTALQAAEAEVKQQQKALQAATLQQASAEKKVAELDEGISLMHVLSAGP